MLRVVDEERSMAEADGRRAGATTNSTSYAYDGLGRLTSRTTAYAVDPSFAYYVNFGFGYNPAGQIASRSRSSDSYAFTGYLNVNRGYQRNGLNQYTQAGNLALSYDPNGNLTSDSVNGYGYDIENRLVSGGGATLTWDPLGRLYQVAGGLGTTQFLYDGDQLAGEYNAGGALLRRYVHGTGEDDPLIWYEGAGLTSRRALMTDHQGSIIAVSDGSSTSAYRYDEYGIPGANQPGRFQYTGQAWLPELGMYHYKARIYSPTLGRFLQTDPIGYDDQINLYAYVGNDPVNGKDPEGTACARNDGSVCGFARDFLIGDIEDAIANPSAASVAIAAVTTVFKPAKILDKAVDGVRSLKKFQRSEAAAERARNAAKGVPDSQLGPSGKPKVHSVQHPSRKRAQQAAKQEADRAGGKVRNDANPTDGQKPHFQAEDARGQNVKPVVHHCRPRKDCT